MRTIRNALRRSWLCLALLPMAGGGLAAQKQPPPPVYTNTAPAWPAATPTAAPAAVAAPPPSKPAMRSQAELEKLAAPIALYPDPLIATILPASVYPVDVVLAARFVADTNNIPRIDAQPWDDSVKAVAKFPSVIKKLNDDLNWTIELGRAFVDQQQGLMDAIQALRTKAQSAGTLKTTDQQVVVVTNAVVERMYDQQVVYVTNTVVQIQPSNPQVVYVPQYNPSVVYTSGYVDPVAPLVTFGAGIALGAIIANNCDWHYGGVYVGGGGMVVWGGGGSHPPYYPPPPGYRPPPYAPPPGYRPPPPGTRPPGYPPPGSRPPGTQPPGARPPGATTMPAQRWQPDQSRLNASGAPSAATREARGWGSGTGAGTRPPTASTGAVGSRPPTRPVAPTPRPSTGAVYPGARPSTGVAAPAARPSSPGTPRPSPSAQRATGGYGGSAFGGMGNGASTRSYSNRGATSRGGRFGAAGGRAGGGGGGRARGR